MERKKLENSQAQEIVSEGVEAQLCELSDLQMTLVGGGITDVIAANTTP